MENVSVERKSKQYSKNKIFMNFDERERAINKGLKNRMRTRVHTYTNTHTYYTRILRMCVCVFFSVKRTNKEHRHVVFSQIKNT